jgi:cell cycle arrest protein BUB2
VTISTLSDAEYLVHTYTPSKKLESMSNSSPTKESIPKLAPPISTPLNDPPSPRTHRALRRLQSAHTLGQSNQPSLISQQHRQALQRNLSPASNPSLSQPSRGRSNSDASNMTPPNSRAAVRRPVSGKRPIPADALSLDRLIREGPPDGDVLGALESTRLKILDQGIKSDTDGMVSVKCVLCK